MAQLTILYWRDIPAQLIAKKGRDTAKRPLPERFEKAIDRAAMRANLRDTDSYLAEWRKGEPIAIGEDIEAEIERMAKAIETEFDDAKLKQLIVQGGRANPERPNPESGA